MASNMTTGAETNVVTTSQMATAREVDFVERFTGSALGKLMEALGVARTVPMMEGTAVYVYRTSGTLQSGAVTEGEVIPLSQYQRTKTAVGEIALNKWRKAVTAEAIRRLGYDGAMRETDAKMLSDIQKSVRAAFFGFLTGLDGTVVAASTLQAVLAKSWGKLQVLFEDDSVEPVHFIHPLTIADYLATATVTTQTAFGMSYIADFLGMGTVVMSSLVPQGQVYSTAKDNLVMYYLAMNGDVARAFSLTVDESGYIGMHTSQTDNRAQIETLVMSGIQFMVEYADGVVIGQIDSTPTLQSVSVTSTDSGVSTAGDSKISMSGYSLGSGEKWVYKTGASAAPSVSYGQKLGSAWTEIDSGDVITPTASHTRIAVAAVDANGRAQAAGSATLVVKSA